MHYFHLIFSMTIGVPAAQIHSKHHPSAHNVARCSWLDTRDHVSFADDCNPASINFGGLRVLNDDSVKPGRGLGLHRNQNMEIIARVVLGEPTVGATIRLSRAAGSST
jgi:redox-sensitive bicupin YhaK (pirin superfamily)